MSKRLIIAGMIVLLVFAGALCSWFLVPRAGVNQGAEEISDLQSSKLKETYHDKGNEEPVISKIQKVEDIKAIESEQSSILNITGETIEKRYIPPAGFVRISIDEDSFGAFLRNQKLKPYGEKALYYNGKAKHAEGIYDSVIDVQIGDRDLHQCADAIMLLRAEYLYQKGNFEQIAFNFVNGFKADYQKWMNGYRIKINGNNVSWSKEASFSTAYESFRKYMDMVFAYAGTASLEKELVSIDAKDMAIGDLFIKGGSPGHAVIVVDMAENKTTGEKVFMLAQSYMPAQQTQILINPDNNTISPWYMLDEAKQLVTPEWQFEKAQLKRFLQN